MAKVALISDTHGILLPEIDPDVDFIIHAGDIAPDSWFTDRNREKAIAVQHEWFTGPLSPWRDWLASHGKHVYATWGNHDFYGEKIRNLNHKGYTILTNQLIEVGGLKTWFSPYVKKIGGWAFGEDDETSVVWGQIPDDTQVIVSHTPPCGLGDLIVAPHISWGAYENVGSKRLLNRCMELKDLRLVVCGHIHEGRGIYSNDRLGFQVFNVSVLNERYTPVADPVVYIEWPTADRGEEGYGFGV